MGPASLVAGATGISITFTGAASAALTGGKVGFTKTSTCTAAATTMVIAAAGTSTVTLPSAGVYSVCYQADGGSDSVLQTATGMTLTASGTAATVVTAIVPASISAGHASTIVFTGDTITAADTVEFVKDVAGTATVCPAPTITMSAEKKAVTTTSLTAGTHTV